MSGRYHWESWVAYSQQEASHGTLQAILDDSLRPGDKSAIAGVTAKQGEYGAYEYGARYGRDSDGVPFFKYDVPGGQEHEFTVPAFRAFLESIKQPKTGVVPSKFKVTESGNRPWYDRPEVNKQQLENAAAKWADRPGAGALLRAGEGQHIPGRPGQADRPTEPYAPSIKFSPRRRDEAAFLATRRVRADRAGDDQSSVSYTRQSRGNSGRSGLLGVSYDAEWKAGPGLRKIYEGAGIKMPVRVLELKGGDATNAAKYAEAIRKAKNESKYGAAVAVYSPDEYQNYRYLLLSDDAGSPAPRSSRMATSSPCNSRTRSPAMRCWRPRSRAGGRKLDAFDTILPEFYHMHGFVEAGRVKWDDSQAPEDWSPKRFADFNNGKPDIVLMVLDRADHVADARTRAEVYDTWDEAAAAPSRRCWSR